MYEKEIQAGAALLDRERPGWELLIDPSTLKLASAVSCVLGQVMGNFWSALDVLSISEGQGAMYGFTIPFKCSSSKVNHAWDDGCCWSRLTEEWITFIKQRLNRGVNIGSDVLAPTV